jgi:hypothetical protein
MYAHTKSIFRKFLWPVLRCDVPFSEASWDMGILIPNEIK